MFSEEELGVIVGYFRSPVVPAPIASVSDVKVSPNDILLGYFLAGTGPDRAALSTVLGDMSLLRTSLASCAPSPASEEGLPELPFFMSYLEGPVYVSRALREVAGCFAAGHGSAMIVADAEPRRYEYPSGFSVDYCCLVNERTANMSVFDMAVALPETGDIYVRQNSVLAMLSYLDAVRAVQPSLIGSVPAGFEHDVLGISIAHEICEMRLVEKGRSGDLELEAELSSMRFLEEHGVSLDSYALFHRLRAGRPGDSQGVDYSLKVLEGLR
ncbi:hypothetical protein KY363_00910 [Candidatus Woesearchaeota archaeon]|nr:hypothetical protein [Candidatus Woesearchaeota archaeon]